MRTQQIESIRALVSAAARVVAEHDATPRPWVLDPRKAPSVFLDTD